VVFRFIRAGDAPSWNAGRGIGGHSGGKATMPGYVGLGGGRHDVSGGGFGGGESCLRETIAARHSLNASSCYMAT
jgi:hypothetical protein